MSIKVTYSDVIKLRKILIMIDTTLTSLDISDVDTVWTGGRGKRPPPRREINILEKFFLKAI